MEYETATDERCLKNINHFDLDKYCDKAVAKQGSTIAASREEPVQRSWLFVYVQLPSRLAEVTMLSIVIYEALVGVSLGVRVLRYVMVQWLMYVLLSINAALIGTLVVLVWRSKKDVSLRLLWKLIQDHDESKDRGRANLMDDV